MRISRRASPGRGCERSAMRAASASASRTSTVTRGWRRSVAPSVASSGRRVARSRVSALRRLARALAVSRRGGEPAGGVAPGQAARVEGEQGDEAPGALRQCACGAVRGERECAQQGDADRRGHAPAPAGPLDPRAGSSGGVIDGHQTPPFLPPRPDPPVVDARIVHGAGSDRSNLRTKTRSPFPARVEPVSGPRSSAVAAPACAHPSRARGSAALIGTVCPVACAPFSPSAGVQVEWLRSGAGSAKRAGAGRWRPRVRSKRGRAVALPRVDMRLLAGLALVAVIEPHDLALAEARLEGPLAALALPEAELGAAVGRTATGANPCRRARGASRPGERPGDRSGRARRAVSTQGGALRVARDAADGSASVTLAAATSSDVPAPALRLMGGRTGRR